MKKVITIILFSMIVGSLWADTSTVKGESVKSELLRKLSKAPNDSTRLFIYRQLARVAENSQIEVYYINKMIAEAEAQNNTVYRCRGYLWRMNIAYNKYDETEVKRWMLKLEPLALKEKLYDFLFLGQRCIIDMMILNGEYEREEKAALQMLKSAQKLKCDLGVILANQCLGNVYCITYRWGKAAIVLKEAYDVAYRLNDLSMIEVNNSLIDVYATLGDKKNWLKWIQTMDENVQHRIGGNPELEVKYRGTLLVNTIAYLRYYTSVKDYVHAAIYLKRMEAYRMPDYSAYEYNYHSARLDYFKEVGLFNEALVEANELVDIYEGVTTLSYIQMKFKKADLLALMGRNDDAISIYQQMFAMSDSTNIDLLNKQTDQLKKDYNTDTLMLEKEVINRRLQVLLLALVLVVIIIIAISMIHTYRVRKELEKAESDMRKMTQEMDLANIAKEKFLSTISSSISIPLNSVVDGALKLATDEVTDVQARQRISGELNRTSAELMELINKILDLSKLEAGMMKFRVENLEICPFVQGILTMAASNGQTIVADFQDAVKTVQVQVDIARLQELFNNLLLPSEQELSLAMQMAEDGEYVSFCIRGTVVACDEQTQKTMLVNEVNRLLIEHFGGHYELKLAKLSGSVCFDLPIWEA